ncbi:hypothetical protein LOZ61_006017 [Ophidiomyces ophidiicola]|uniref:Uncharacterized protein n=1 Tax=Ophidiomyces ophidiicola TaxID=1387563 RepID=A0ACB8UTA2_9EURO|nr:hypothetical protein LOZ61_006017 [Ophidiomyces ophidiicola]KAI1922861.1 hypothetical protein LOZ60_005456 [Ophidiomyces ophidiicola]KAI1955510.1 hypothetical protein LOZ59_004502 [Ophidiomyces ophidiicola]KAI1968923.1 hypothetical protein LOZ56_004668 [Ophidiomyces ophidiicola]KAI2005007.1 hypothetical protein LOZ50_003898 [Ophidiomyces ophidiicola]
MASQALEQVILRDSALFYWILIPITVVMVLTGILRHYATVLMTSPAKPATSLAEYRERLSLLRGINLRNNASAAIGHSSLAARKAYLISAYKTGLFLKDSDCRGKGPPNPMTDPAGMDAMMGMMKSNMAMMIPQTLIMSWINAFFSGFVILKLPFPLTIRFKSMLQSGVITRDLDPIFGFILGSENSAGQMLHQMSPTHPSTTVNPFGPGQDPDKLFLAEAENLEVMEQYCVFEGIEERLLQKVSSPPLLR